MEKILEQTLLFDFYGELLTDHQKTIYEAVVLNDLSLGEAAGEYGVSRQGIHDLLKRCNRLLEGYEEKLHLLEKHLESRKHLVVIRQAAEQLADREELAQLAAVIRQAADALAEL